MASEEDVVRISFTELDKSPDSAGKSANDVVGEQLSQTSGSRQDKKKRPPRQIYQPGRGVKKKVNNDIESSSPSFPPNSPHQDTSPISPDGITSCVSESEALCKTDVPDEAASAAKHTLNTFEVRPTEEFINKKEQVNCPQQHALVSPGKEPHNTVHENQGQIKLQNGGNKKKKPDSQKYRPRYIRNQESVNSLEKGRLSSETGSETRGRVSTSRENTNLVTDRKVDIKRDEDITVTAVNTQVFTPSDRGKSEQLDEKPARDGRDRRSDNTHNKHPGKPIPSLLDGVLPNPNKNSNQSPTSGGQLNVDRVDVSSLNSENMVSNAQSDLAKNSSDSEGNLLWRSQGQDKDSVDQLPEAQTNQDNKTRNSTGGKRYSSARNKGQKGRNGYRTDEQISQLKTSRADQTGSMKEDTAPRVKSPQQPQGTSNRRDTQRRQGRGKSENSSEQRNTVSKNDDSDIPHRGRNLNQPRSKSARDEKMSTCEDKRQQSKQKSDDSRGDRNKPSAKGGRGDRQQGRGRNSTPQDGVRESGVRRDRNNEEYGRGKSERRPPQGRGQGKGGLDYPANQDKRKVPERKDDENEKTERRRWNSGASYDSNQDREDPSKTARGGGLLRLPSSGPVQCIDPSKTDESFPALPHHTKAWDSTRRSFGRGNGRKLFDPKNPAKPTNGQKSMHGPAQQAAFGQQLHFQDTDDRITSPSERSSHYTDYYNHFAESPVRSHSSSHRAVYPYKQERLSSAEFGRGDYYYNYPSQAVPYYDNNMYYDYDHYYHSGFDPDSMPTPRTRPSAGHISAQQAFVEAVSVEKQLAAIISRRFSVDSLERIEKLRIEFQRCCEEIVISDPDLAAHQNVESVLWKSGFYQLIECTRKQIQEGETDLKTWLFQLLEQGTTFYEGFLHRLQSTYEFSVEDYLDHDRPPPETSRRHVKLALLTSQRIFICLGDIARYKEQAHDSNNFGRARSWYLKAQTIAPKNGRPYNQLAVLAVYTRRKLDAVYYYMRSLLASNPFLTARESLMSLFDEARKKSQVAQKKRLEEKDRLKRTKEHLIRQNTGHRVEVWIAPDGSSSQDNINHEEDVDELVQLPNIQLNRRFMLSFLNVHGKLFTKIGMEYFADVASQMLLEFEALLQRTPEPIGHMRALQLIVINMFSVENSGPPDQPLSPNVNGCRPLLQEYSVQLGLDMFGVLVHRIVALFQEHLKSPKYPQQVLSEDLQEIFPGIKVWSDWMSCHAHCWNPPPNPRDPGLGPNIDVWRTLAQLFNILKTVDTSHVKLHQDPIEGGEVLLLPEEAMLSGYVPLLSSPLNTVYIEKLVDKDLARDCLRIEKLSVFGEYLCGIEPPLLAYDVHHRKYVSIAPSANLSEKESSGSQQIIDHEDDDVIIESEELEDECASGDEEHIRELRNKREQLQQQVAEQEKYQQDVQAVLESENRIIELEIAPTYLVPDTNCFIDHLKGIGKLVNSKKFTIVVPLVVINELDGLGKGHRDGDHDEHAEMVKQEAQRSVMYLEEQFDRGNSHLKALTSQGNVLSTISFRTEETQRIGNNDDLILSCCVYYCKDKARDFMPKDRDTPIRLHREVVLLTDDRNLRLKAHTRNVPVKDVPSFLKWSKVG